MYIENEQGEWILWTEVTRYAGKKTEIIVHYVNRTLPVGTKIRGEIYWDTRYGYMQNHTGEHMVSGCVHKRFGYDNVGFHMGRESVVIDFNGELNWEQLMEIEEEVNRGVDANLSVKVEYPSRGELSQMTYRSKKEISGQVRVVIIPGYDSCACCGMHVARTAEIQMIKILSVQNHRGGVGRDDLWKRCQRRL